MTRPIGEAVLTTKGMLQNMKMYREAREYNLYFQSASTYNSCIRDIKSFNFDSKKARYNFFTQTVWRVEAARLLGEYT